MVGNEHLSLIPRYLLKIHTINKAYLNLCLECKGCSILRQCRTASDVLWSKALRSWASQGKQTNIQELALANCSCKNVMAVTIRIFRAV